MPATGITRIRGGQIQERTIQGININTGSLLNEHLAANAQIAESKLNIAWADRYQDALETKKVVDYVQVNGTTASGSSIDLSDLGIIANNIAQAESNNTAEGILVDAPKNRVSIRSVASGDSILDANDQEVYGKITFVAATEEDPAKYVLSFYTGSDVAYTFASNTAINWQYAQRFNLYSVSEMFAANEKFVEGAADVTAYLNIEQLAKDLYGSVFSLDRDGNANLGTSIQGQINNEVSRAQGAEFNLQTAIDNEIEDRQNAISDVYNDFSSTLVTSGATLVGVDATSALNGLTVQDVLEDLESRMSSQESGGGAEVTATHTRDANTANDVFAAGSFANLEARIVDIEGTVDSEVTTLQSNIDAEELRAENAEAAIQSELDTTQSGAGLNANGTYSANGSANYINAATSLKDADNTLDTALKTEETARISADSAIQSELDTTQSGAGLNANGTYSANVTANYISSSTSLKDADDDLDAALKTEETARIAADSAIQSEVDTTQTGAGLNANGTYSANTSADYIDAAISLKDADNLLDAALKTEETARIAADSALQSELDTSQVGAGLNANGTYSANGAANYINAATSLKDADNTLDTALKAEETARISADSALQSEVDATQVGAGLGTNGAYTANGAANYISGATSLKDADNTLDTALKTEETARISADSALQSELDTTQSGAGLNANGTYTANVSANYISASTSLKDADDDLDSALKAEETARIAADSAMVSDFASTANGKGASLIGVEDAAAQFAASTVEGVLAEIQDNVDELIADLASTANGDGATLIGVEDAAGQFTASTVEGVLAEIQDNVDELIVDLASTSASEGAALVGVESGSGLTGSTVQAVLEDHVARIGVLEGKAHEHKKAVINVTSTITSIDFFDETGDYYVADGTLNVYVNGILQANGFNFDEVKDGQNRGTDIDFGTDELVNGDRVVIEYVVYQVDQYV